MSSPRVAQRCAIFQSRDRIFNTLYACLSTVYQYNVRYACAACRFRVVPLWSSKIQKRLMQHMRCCLVVESRKDCAHASLRPTLSTPDPTGGMNFNLLCVCVVVTAVRCIINSRPTSSYSHTRHCERALPLAHNTRE